MGQLQLWQIVLLEKVFTIYFPAVAGDYFLLLSAQL